MEKHVILLSRWHSLAPEPQDFALQIFHWVLSQIPHIFFLSLIPLTLWGLSDHMSPGMLASQPFPCLGPIQSSQTVIELDKGQSSILPHGICQKCEHRLRDLWDTIRWANIWAVEFPEDKEKEKGAKKLFEEIMARNFSSLRKDMNKNMQEAQLSPSKVN